MESGHRCVSIIILQSTTNIKDTPMHNPYYQYTKGQHCKNKSAKITNFLVSTAVANNKGDCNLVM